MGQVVEFPAPRRVVAATPPGAAPGGRMIVIAPGASAAEVQRFLEAGATIVFALPSSLAPRQQTA